MPIYEYKCKKCGHEFEVSQKMSDAPIKKCEKCEGAVDKLISQSSFALKGTGWYRTDYASGGSSDSSKKKCESAGGDCSACCPSAK